LTQARPLITCLTSRVFQVPYAIRDLIQSIGKPLRQTVESLRKYAHHF